MNCCRAVAFAFAPSLADDAVAAAAWFDCCVSPRRLRCGAAGDCVELFVAPPPPLSAVVAGLCTPMGVDGPVVEARERDEEEVGLSG